MQVERRFRGRIGRPTIALSRGWAECLRMRNCARVDKNDRQVPNGLMRTLTIAVAAALFLLAGLSPAAAASPRQIKWEELSTVVGKTVSIAMPGAVVITGKATAVEPSVAS